MTPYDNTLMWILCAVAGVWAMVTMWLAATEKDPVIRGAAVAFLLFIFVVLYSAAEHGGWS